MIIKLKPFSDEDLPLFITWLHSSHIARWYSPAEDWIAEIRGRKDTYDWIHHYIICADDVPVGFCQYYPYWRSGETWHGSIPAEETYSVDYLIGDVSYLRRGCASEALRQLNAMILESTKARRIIAQPEKDNSASRNALLSAGYSYDKSNDLFILEP